MPRVNPIQTAFNAGEFSPKLAAREDFDKYRNAGAVFENVIPLPQGGWTRRPGTRFAWEVKDSSTKTRLLNFQFSTSQAYVIEAGNKYFRFGKDQGQIVAADTSAAIVNGAFTSNIGSWTARNSGTGTISWDSANKDLNLNGGGAGNEARAYQAVATTAAGVEHVISFKVLGAPGDSITVRVGSAAGGSQYLGNQSRWTGWHTIAFTPAASPFYLEFENARNKTVSIDDVAVIDNAPVELATPYAAADLFELKIAQSADVAYIAHPDYPIHKLTRTGHSSWAMIEVNWRDGPWLDQNENAAKTLTASAISGNGVTLTATGHNPFRATDVGRQVRLQHGATQPGWAVIAGYINTAQVIVDVRRAFNAVTATSKWRLGSWSVTTGYPAAVSFFEQRFVAGRTSTQTQTLWMSQSADLENMRPDSYDTGVTVQDDDSLDYTIAAKEVNAIRWFAPGKQLVIGTVGGEWIASSKGPVLTPSDIVIKRHTAHGSANIEPVQVSNVVLFVQAAGRKLREFAYNFESDAYRAPDMTILSDHITRSGLVELAYQEEPDTVLWGVRNDGVMPTLTYRRSQQVVGWARQVLGGSFGTGRAEVESVAVIPGTNGPGQFYDSTERDEVWVAVKRTVNGITKRYVEFFEGVFEGPLRDDYDSEAGWQAATVVAQKDGFFVDCGATYSGAATTSISGLDYLEGETVKILADGRIHPDKVVTGGAVALDYAASRVHIGLGYAHTYKSLKMIAGAAAGTAIGKKKRIPGLTAVLLDATTVNYGPSTAALKPMEFFQAGDAMDTAVPLFTGEKFVEFAGNWGRDPRVVFRGDAPLPFTLLALTPEVAVNDLR